MEFGYFFNSMKPEVSAMESQIKHILFGINMQIVISMHKLVNVFYLFVNVINTYADLS